MKLRDFPNQILSEHDSDHERWMREQDRAARWRVIGLWGACAFFGIMALSLAAGHQPCGLAWTLALLSAAVALVLTAANPKQ